VIAIIAVAALLVYQREQASSPNSCQPLGGAKELKSQLSNVTFDAITEFELPTLQRWPNAVAVAPDGSIWFGEETVPGVAHLYTNGTLVEYAWPVSKSSLDQGTCEKADIWGVALWDGMVWGTDMEASSLVGLNPTTDTFRIVNISQSATSPYTLTIGPDGNLWFTVISSPAEVGRVSPDGAFSMIRFSNYTTFLPTGLAFANASLAYYVGVDFPQDNGGLFAFNPQVSSSIVTPRNIGGDLNLTSPNALAVTPTAIWISEHGPARVAAYNLTTGVWTPYPTSTVSYTDTTLPYFIAANGSRIWFNEHYGNRIAEINTTASSLTEYSESNPPVTNGTQIGNDLTIALARNGIWFTATTANYIGFASASYVPSFSMSAVGSNSLAVATGQEGSVSVRVKGTAARALTVETSDSENLTSVPSAIRIVPSSASIVANGTTRNLEVAVSVGASTRPGEYTLDVTVTDGLIYQTVFLFLTVS